MHSKMPSALSKLKHKLVPGSGTRSPSRDVLEEEEAKVRASTEKLSMDNDRKDRKERQEAEIARKKKEADERAAREEPAEMRAKYGTLDVRHATPDNHPDSTDVVQLALNHAPGQQVAFRARVHAIRNVSAHLVFIVFRRQEWTIQGVLKQQDGIVSEHWVRWAEHIHPESVVYVQGVLKAPQHAEVKGCSIHDVEIDVQQLHVIAEVTDSLPFSVYQLSPTDVELQKGDTREQDITETYRLANRIVDLRTATSQAVFRVNAGICNVFRSSLDSQGFIEIHTPKLQGGATESGASVFQLDYFGRPAFLAQSPQLAKQMCIAADMERVYEVGPVFRAENSNTKRHLTEYTGLDLEMAIQEDYHEALDVIDNMFKSVWKNVYTRWRHEIDLIKRQYPHEDLVWLEETPRLPFKKGIEILRASGWVDDEGNPPSDYEDLSTRAEIRLGELIKEQYHTDYYILDKFPASARPFYTMPDQDDPDVTNSFDIFLRGQEILSGGQRIHDANMLEEQMQKLHMQFEGMEEYLEGFRWGAPPHAGGGIGLERVVMLLLSLGNIRLASLFPRDPQSIRAKPQTVQIRHPEASTLHPPWQRHHGIEGIQFQPLEKLIANYGDSTNTSYLEERTRIWRSEQTGAAIGWVQIGDNAMIFGDPLCERVQYAATIIAFLRYLGQEHKHLKPIWLLVGPQTESVLGDKLEWNTLSCVAEQRAETTNVTKAKADVTHKIEQAKRHGVKCSSFGQGEESLPEDFKREVSEGIESWQQGRKGKQAHISELNTKMVFQDLPHRWFFQARDKDGKLVCFIVLVQLSQQHGWQVKYSTDFPGSPSGAVEALTMHALETARGAGIKNVTFGAGATPELESGHGLKGVQVKVLRRTYKEIASALAVGKKTGFREKLGAHGDPVWIAYPKHGLGPGGIKAVMDFFGAE
jgi:nondiscriminating aspartyl-tRNA synthetase